MIDTTPCDQCLIFPICVSRVIENIKVYKNNCIGEIIIDEADIGVNMTFGVNSNKPCSLLNEYIYLRYNKYSGEYIYETQKLYNIKDKFRNHIQGN